MTAQLDLSGRTEVDHNSSEARALEVAYTPAPVVRQLMDTLDMRHGFGAPSVLDPSAGSGVFGAEARLRWPESTILGVEPRIEPHPDAYDYWVTSTFEAFSQGHAFPPFDLVATNPPFSLAAKFVELSRPIMTNAGLLVLLLPVDWWQRRESLYAWATDPVNVWREVLTIGGPVSYRGPGNAAAFQNYAWFVWDKFAPRHDGPIHWRTTPLPWLPGPARKWTTTPGR